MRCYVGFRLVLVASLCVGCTQTAELRAPHTPVAPPARPHPSANVVSTSPREPTPFARYATTIGNHHALMLGMRLTEVWLWPEPFAETRPSILRERYRDAFTNPPKWDSRAPWFQWDGDRWFINVIGHAAFGSELYLRARRCDFHPLGAFALTVASSTVWEYGYEASGVRPSAFDLIYTPVSGFVIGEARHWLVRRAQHLDSGWRTLVTVLLDPFGEAERAIGLPC